jgi:hypothetical protein
VDVEAMVGDKVAMSDWFVPGVVVAVILGCVVGRQAYRKIIP